LNIFVTNKNPQLCAEFLDDKRVVKMCLESAQMLSTAINLNGGNAPYKSTHINHPCNKWVRQSRSNYIWLCEHLIYLLKEYTKRYNKIHAITNLVNCFIDNIDLFPFNMCICAFLIPYF
jgi:hypothetical protein